MEKRNLKSTPVVITESKDKIFSFLEFEKK